eukprot:gnl/Spiro4/22225_TR10941_c0_g1_i1.p2 gnl/Spiro4/22225_TR10941_c0_g1~~gnl/Spiro4/22225_TR10941_c0_g1_i1.p2  ORF type:complete len:324 (-),score=44.12 gnl/Spiro4/22225_TR10941_c0_g1_i1:97-1038(-)
MSSVRFECRCGRWEDVAAGQTMPSSVFAERCPANAGAGHSFTSALPPLAPATGLGYLGPPTAVGTRTSGPQNSSLISRAVSAMIAHTDCGFGDNVARRRSRKTSMEQIRGFYLSVFQRSTHPILDLATSSLDFVDSDVLGTTRPCSAALFCVHTYTVQIESRVGSGTSACRFMRATSTSQLPFTIGRDPTCTLSILSEDVSRLHAVVFCYPCKYVVNHTNPSRGVLVVVDVGSLHGIRTLRRSGRLPPQHSTPDNRNVLMFEWGETFQLLFGNQRVRFAPADIESAYRDEFGQRSTLRSKPQTASDVSTEGPD